MDQTGWEAAPQRTARKFTSAEPDSTTVRPRKARDMETPAACFYCTKDSSLTDLMIPVATLNASIVYLFREQTY